MIEHMQAHVVCMQAAVEQQLLLFLYQTRQYRKYDFIMTVIKGIKPTKKSKLMEVNNEVDNGTIKWF
ncbi:MAG: hypothetical protein GTO45_09900 [Candidatus Aminicenantes bacterium]|nr:hypothetical protein [Candidatus Aminicenantes bacterium]NIM79121.1 hypothetical protein [Candidatus Aminicenantes bacterium]NIN18406.1 hypothetical protein [Candidatus Aminicenantes bacterium]NIN42294.1 hypothetical protein [Candidatus Aminicenantes bacterium]NIN85060.1 hypothetical protein [Candidatus Aminicenantes bacterium]